MQTDNFTATAETITPEMAQLYLQLNTNNRNVNKNRVTAYAESMKAGRWMLSGEPLIFSGQRLLNGQHRLMACLQAGVPFTTLVVRNVNDAAFAVLDSGASRRATDVLEMAGWANTRCVGAITSMVHLYFIGNTNRARALDRQVMLRHVNADSERYDAASLIYSRTKRASLPATPVATLAYFVQDHHQFSQFVEGVLIGANLDIGNPALALRNWLAMAGRNYSSRVQFCVVIRAWNAFIEGTQRYRMQLPTDNVVPRGACFYEGAASHFVTTEKEQA